MAGTKKKKGRQNVRRHWKPSLGRFVDRYDRKGENARREQKSAARHRPSMALPPGPPIRVTRGPRIGRRLVIFTVIFVVMLSLIGGFRLAREGRAAAPYEVLVATKPVVIKIDHGSPTSVLTADASELDALVRDAAETIRATAAEHPNRLIVIEPVAPVISYSSLAAADQRVVRGYAGSDAEQAYEHAVARFLERVVTAATNPRVSVLGLPVEPGAAGLEAARRTNRRYGDVIERLEHIVTAHVFFRTDSWVTEQRMVEEAIPEALHRCDGRPIVFRLNLEWRVLVDRTQVGRYRRAEWNTLAN